MMYRSFIVLICFLFSASISNAQKTKVACVGNSVTYGAGIKDRATNSYPAQLQKLLGKDFEVANFGYSGATMLKNGHKPYWEKEAFKKSQEFAPNIVVIHLGLNDQGNNNWPEHKNEFIADYLDMISVYKNLPSKPKIIICKMTPTFSGHHWFEEGMRENFKEIQSKIEEVATQAKVQILNLHEPLYSYPELFPDNLHPTKEGAAIIAQKTYSAITGDFGGLQLPVLYGEGMVIQRHEPIVISGIANAKDEIKVSFNKETVSVRAKKNGTWSLTFPPMKAGGPHSLEIHSKTSESFVLNEVYIGEVWLASGQSNMAFKTNQIKYAPSIIKDSNHTNIHLFTLEGKAWPGAAAFSKTQLESCNAKSYFKASGWQEATSGTVENFSAIAYAYAFNLQKELNVPIGIINNAIGGSTTQSWISRAAMESTHETVDVLNDTHLHPMVQPWTSKRKAENFANKKTLGIKARHPFDPTLLFDAGINPIKNYNIKGVIWYQGESNAERVDFHELLFKMLVKDWRRQWNKPEMPFYFVQLSSIKRSTWGRFRDSQRRLLDEISYSGMAVSSDVGHPTNVHPLRKWVVGERLSKIALAKSYHKNIPFSGPLLDYVNVLNHKLEVHFLHGEGLKTTHGNEIVDIQIAGKDKIFVKATSKIKGNVVEVWSDKIEYPRYIKYGYSPFTESNLVNRYGLPASTFSNLKH